MNLYAMLFPDGFHALQSVRKATIEITPVVVPGGKIFMTNVCFLPTGCKNKVTGLTDNLYRIIKEDVRSIFMVCNQYAQKEAA